MKTIWFQDVKDAKLRDQLKENVLGSKIVLDKAIKIIYTYIKSGEKTKLQDFESPSWALRQAYIEGRKSAFLEIIEVLTLDDE